MKTLSKLILLIFTFIIYTVSYTQSIIYVSNDGDDDSGDGTISNPYETVQYAINQTSDNDTVVIRGGTYLSEEIRIDNNNITVRSFPDEWAVIEAPVDDENISFCIWYHDPEIVGGKLERLEIIGGYYYGIKFESDWNWGAPIADRHGVSNITIKNCRVHDTGRDCFKITPACDNLLIESCEIYNSGIGPANAGDPNAEGIDCVNSDNLTVRNCYIHNTSTTGIYAKGGSINTLIENNLVMNTGGNGILLGFYTDQEWFDSIANPNYYENLNSTVRNNIVINTEWDGIGMYAAYQPKIYNNTVTDAANTGHAALFFNTGYIWIEELQDMYAPPTEDVFVVNNIFSVDENTDSPVAQIRYYEDDPASNMLGDCSVDHNLYYKIGGAEFDDGIDWQMLTFEQWKTSTSFDLNSLETDPLFDSNYHLTSGSPCINNALYIDELQYDYDGGTRSQPFDIGADEYGAGVILAVPPPDEIIGTGNGTPVKIDNNLKKRNPFIICYPNPSNGDFNISLKLEHSEFVTIQLFDITGKLVENIYSGLILKDKQIFSVKSDFPETGIYTLIMNTANVSISKSIILIK